MHLIKAGHVGISWDGGKTIYGFWPTQGEMDALTSQGADVEKLLKENGTIVGQVQNDTEVFKRAYELSTQGAPTEVWQISKTVTDKEFEQIINRVLQQVSEGSPYPSWYRCRLVMVCQCLHNVIIMLHGRVLLGCKSLKRQGK